MTCPRATGAWIPTRPTTTLGLWLDKSSLQYFGSTAAPSILSFYPALGVKRDVRSEPDISNYAPAGGLLSVKYLITTPEKQEDFPRRCGRRMELLRHQRRLHAL